MITLLDYTSGLASVLQRANLAISLQRPDVSTTDIFEDILSKTRLAICNLSVLSAKQKDCIMMQLDTHLNSTAIPTLGRVC